ncbi:uncharacterized protein AKAME5_002245900, partial [Lates japonicus]
MLQRCVVLLLVSLVAVSLAAPLPEATTDDERSASLLTHLNGRTTVEPVTAPPDPADDLDSVEQTE